MAEVVFYEKSGCASNARQKALLAQSGHQVQARDLRQQMWTNVRLLDFLSGLPVSEWFHRAAPAVKSGEIVPTELDEPTALALLRDNPLLIRRPLLQVGNERRAGFDPAHVAAWIGLAAAPETLGDALGDMEACSHHHAPPRVSYVQTGNGSAMRCHFGVTDGHGGCQP